MSCEARQRRRLLETTVLPGRILLCAGFPLQFATNKPALVKSEHCSARNGMIAPNKFAKSFDKVR
jgi:hypothetical protein